MRSNLLPDLAMNAMMNWDLLCSVFNVWLPCIFCSCTVTPVNCIIIRWIEYNKDQYALLNVFAESEVWISSAVRWCTVWQSPGWGNQGTSRRGRPAKGAGDLHHQFQQSEEQSWPKHCCSQGEFLSLCFTVYSVKGSVDYSLHLCLADFPTIRWMFLNKVWTYVGVGGWTIYRNVAEKLVSQTSTWSVDPKRTLLDWFCTLVVESRMICLNCFHEVMWYLGKARYLFFMVR